MTAWKEKANRTVSLVELPYRSRAVVEEYRKAKNLSEHQRAVMERNIWEPISDSRKKTYVRERLLKSLLGVSPMRCRFRAAILRQGDPCAPLWKRIDDVMLGLPEGQRPFSLGQAHKLMTHAKKQAIGGDKPTYKKRLSLAVFKLLAEHDGTPPEQIAANKNGSPVNIGSGEAREFWSVHRKLLMPYIRSRLPADVEELFSEQLYRDFEESVKAAVEMMGARIMRHRKTSRDALAVTYRTRRKRAKKALTLFGLDLPKHGKSLDRDVIKRRYRKVAAAYHPDRHPGQEEIMEERFKETTEAYEQALDWCDYCDSSS